MIKLLKLGPPGIAESLLPIKILLTLLLALRDLPAPVWLLALRALPLTACCFLGNPSGKVGRSTERPKGRARGARKKENKQHFWFPSSIFFLGRVTASSHEFLTRTSFFFLPSQVNDVVADLLTYTGRTYTCM